MYIDYTQANSIVYKGKNPLFHLMIVNYAFGQPFATPQALLDNYVHLTGWAEGVQATGVRVTVWQRFHQNATVEHKGVTYHFVQDDYGPRLRSWCIPWQMHRALAAACATGARQGHLPLVHVNGLLFPLQVAALRVGLPRAIPLVVQHHAEAPWPRWRALVQRLGLAQADAFFFTNRQLAQPWLARRVIIAPDRVYEQMECSSHLAYQDRAVARAATHLCGEPVILWTGNLTPNKDPLTILAGFERLLAQKPDARLYMAFREAPLLPQVQARLAASPRLQESVTLLGKLDYTMIAPYYNSADLFVQGSAKEGSGIALLDALACGVVPVVTDIPAFRTITDQGRAGALWPVGDSDALTQALTTVLAIPLAPQAEKARTLFAQRWSYPVIGRDAVTNYGRILASAGVTPKAN